DKGMALDAAAATDGRAALDLHKRADARLVADPAAVEIDELVEDHVTAELHVVRDIDEASPRDHQETHERSPLQAGTGCREPPRRSECWSASSARTTSRAKTPSVAGRRRSRTHSRKC